MNTREQTATPSGWACIEAGAEVTTVHAAVNPNPVKYIVIDLHTGAKVAGPFNTRTAASRKVDRLDNAYGAYRYSALQTFPIRECRCCI